MKAKNARGHGWCLLARCDGHNRAVLAKRPYWDFLVEECKREFTRALVLMRITNRTVGVRVTTGHSIIIG